MKPTFLDDCYALGIDIGGTKIRFGLIRSDGVVLHEYTLSTMAAEQRVMEQVYLGIDTMLSVKKTLIGAKPLDGIGLGSAGQIDFTTGTVYYASDLIPGYTGTPIKQLLVNRFGLPVYVDNDVNVLALAETFLGAGKNAHHMICLTLGTGVGGAVITDGCLVHGVNGGAGEIGHLSVDWRGPRCICGNLGCLELYASGTGIAQRYREKLAAIGTELLFPNNGASDIVERWMSGEPTATEVMEEMIAALGSAVTSLIHVLNPEVIVIGGGVSTLGETLFAPLRDAVTSRAMPSMQRAVSIVPATLGESSNMVGAALQVWIYNS